MIKLNKTSHIYNNQKSITPVYNSSDSTADEEFLKILIKELCYKNLWSLEKISNHLNISIEKVKSLL